MTDIAGERARLRAQGLEMETRERWGARQDYTSARRVTRPARWLFFHISVTIDGGDLPADEHAAMRTIERIGQERFQIGFPYNAAAFDTGRLHEGQPLTRRGAHTVNNRDDPRFPHNGHGTSSLNYDARALVLPQMVDDDVTDAQIDAAARWGAALCRSGEAVPGALWFGHRDVAFKDCPGAAGYRRLGELNQLTRHYEARGLGRPTPDQEDDDMPAARKVPIASTTPQRFAYVLPDGTVVDTTDDGKPLVKGASSVDAFDAVYHGQPNARQVDIVQSAVRRARGLAGSGG